MNTWILICTIALAVALVSCGGGGGNSTLTEQTPPPPTEQTPPPLTERRPPPLTARTPISREEPSSSTNDVSTSVNRVKIAATEPDQAGIIHIHNGQGTVTVTVNNSNIETTGEINAHGIGGWRLGTTGEDNNVNINVRNAVITTTGDISAGIRGWSTNVGDVNIHVQGGSITTTGDESGGIHVSNEGAGTDNDITIDVRNAVITTTGDLSDGIIGLNEFAGAGGDVDIDVQGGAITTMGIESAGIRGLSQGVGDVTIDVRDVTIMTKSTDLHPTFDDTYSIGIFGNHKNIGNIDINAHDGSAITTMGKNSHGIIGFHSGTGNIDIDALEGSAITTTGAGAHGIVAYHLGTMDSRSIEVTIGGTVNASGTNAHGVQIGRLTPQGEVERAAGVDPADGYRRQTVRVNGSVWGGSGEAAGVFLAGGGRVYIGPDGSVGADSGIAILAAGVTPKLYLDMNLDGRQVTDVINDDWIINDGGETTIVVNGTTLHDGAMGATANVAANGAWNVMMREEGVIVVDRSDPANWVISNPTTGVVADRDFSTDDFDEMLSSINNSPVFTEVYAPRAALYEALPGFLLHLNGGGGLARERLRSPDSPVRFRLSGSTGSHAPDHATVGSEFDFNHLTAQVGLDVAISENLTSLISLHQVTGSADVSAPTGGGEIETKGIGASLEVFWRSANGYYANGGFSLTDYDMDITSGDRSVGILEIDAAARGNSLAIETGRRLRLNEKMTLTPRAWLARSGVSMDKFTDAVNSRVSFTDAEGFTGGVGVTAEKARSWEGGASSLRGWLEIEQTLSSAGTLADVSGEKLESESSKPRLLLSLGSDYRMDRFSVGGEISVGDLGSDDTQYAGQLYFKMQF